MTTTRCSTSALGRRLHAQLALRDGHAGDAFLANLLDSLARKRRRWEPWVRHQADERTETPASRAARVEETDMLRALLRDVEAATRQAERERLAREVPALPVRRALR